MPAIGPNCHELRVNDQGNAWRVIYCIGQDAIVILAVFAKKAQRTPTKVIASCKRRLRLYEEP
jgi:phage-related protein